MLILAVDESLLMLKLRYLGKWSKIEDVIIPVSRSLSRLFVDIKSNKVAALLQFWLDG